MGFLSLQKLLCIVKDSGQTQLHPVSAGTRFCLGREKWHQRNGTGAWGIACHLLLDCTLRVVTLWSQGNSFTAVKGWKQWLSLKAKSSFACHHLYKTFGQPCTVLHVPAGLLPQITTRHRPINLIHQMDVPCPGEPEIASAPRKAVERTKIAFPLWYFL